MGDFASEPLVVLYHYFASSRPGKVAQKKGEHPGDLTDNRQELMADVAWKQFNCYEVLGVGEAATLAEIRAAYREATRRAHPDRGGSHEAQVKVNLAFEVLSGGLRSEHDAFWHARRARRSTNNRTEPRRFSRTGNLENLWSRGGDRLTDGKATGGFVAAVEARLAQERKRLQDDVAFRERALATEGVSRLMRARAEALVALGLALILGWVALRQPLVWALVAGLLIPVVKRALGVVWHERKFSIFAPLLLSDVRAHALAAAQASADRDTAPLAAHQEALDELKLILRRPTEPDEAPVYFARRLAAAFFFIGYAPLRWQPEDARLIIARGESEVALQVRPAGKRSLSVTQIDRLLSELRAARQREAYLFVLSSVSVRARERAGESGVRCFDLVELNEWIPSLLTSGYRGPGGDPLVALIKLRQFLQTLDS